MDDILKSLQFVEPLSVAATIALTFKFNAVCATDTPIALTNEVSTNLVRSDNNFCNLEPKRNNNISHCFNASSGYKPAAVSPESITASVPS